MQVHVPYRDSVLTKLLAGSLGGNARTCMVANCGPAPSNASETTSTLRFAARVKSVKNKPVVVTDPKDAKLKEMSEEIEKLKAQISEQREAFEAAQEAAQARAMKEAMREVGLQCLGACTRAADTGVFFSLLIFCELTKMMMKNE